MPPTFLLTAAQCPPLQVATAPLNIADALATNAEVIVTGDASPGAGLDKLVRNFARLDANARGGGAGRIASVAFGLGLGTTTGTTVTVAPGQGMMDGAFPQALVPDGVGGFLPWSDVAPDNQPLVRVWFRRNAALTFETGLTVPGVDYLFIGTVTTNNPVSTVTGFDASGVPYQRNGLVEVRTADVGTPGQLGGANPLGVVFLHRTATGAYVWWNDHYEALNAGAPLIPESVAAGTTLVVPAGYQLPVFRRFTVHGTGTRLQVRGRFRTRG